MIGDALDFARNVSRRQNKIDKAGANRAPRHRVELRALFILRERQTAGRFNRAQTSRAVAAGSGEHDADRTRPVFFSERLKKMIDRDVESLCSVDHSEHAVLRNYTLVWWLDVNGVRFRR